MTTLTTSHRVLALLIIAAVSVWTGCGGDDGGGSSNNANNTVDAGHDATPDGNNSQPDAGTNNTTSGDAGTDDTANADPLPALVEVKFNPARAVVVPGASPTARATVYDTNGETMGAVDLSWTVSPEDGATQESSTRWTFEEEGVFTFEACTTAAGPEGEPVCGSKDLIVDAGPPSIELLAPEPGAQLGGDGSQTVQVEGRVTDNSEHVAAFVNGQSVDLDSEGGFTTELPLHFGINHIRVSASDGRHPDNGTAQRDVLWAPAWYEASNGEDDVAVNFDDGILLDLGQNFFDDGLPAQTVNESDLVTKDLADIFTLLLKNVDFLGQIPNPLADSGALQLEISDISMGEPDIVINVTDAGLELFIHIPNLLVQTAGSLDIEGQQLDLTGSITASASAIAEMTIDKPAPDQPFEATVDHVSIAIDEANSSFASPEADAVFELAESALRSKIEEMLVDALQEQFIDSLPELLLDALNSLETTLADLSFDLDAGFTEPLTLNINGSIEQFDTLYRDSMFARLSTDVSIAKTATFPDSKGVPLVEPISQEYPLFEKSRAQIAVRVAMLNGLLHTLWDSGFLEIDLTNLLPDQFAGVVNSAHLSTKLQPVLAPPQEGEPYDFMLSAGQMVVDVELPTQTDRYGVYIKAGINMSLDDNAISITVPDEPQLSAWVIETDAEDPFFNGAALESLILSQVWPEIEDTLKDGLSFELPVPELSDLSQLAPTLSNLILEFALERPIAVRGGYIFFDAALQGTLPLGQ